MAIELNDVTSGYNLSAINTNFQRIEDALNDSVVWRKGSVAGEALMERDLDMNSHAILNIGVDLSNPGSLLTVAAADLRYYNITGDTLEGTLNAGSNRITGLPPSQGISDAVPKQELLNESTYRQQADANLQAQITGDIPLEASAFSEISWHGQEIVNSLTIPANKNAWSFGPQMEIKEGQLVTISPGSTWTVADGRVVENEDLHHLIANSITTSDASYTINISEIAKDSDVNALEASVASLTSRMTAEEGKVQPIELGGTGATTDSTARANLGLGNAATRNVGTASGTVAAGDDTRFSGRLISQPRRFTTNQTYTPTAGMTYAIVYGISGGGAGGGTVATSASQVAVGTGGNSGVAAKVLLTAAQIGASQALTIGAGGVGVSGAAGNNGGASSFGSLFTLPGGLGGFASAATANTGVYAEAAGPAQPAAPTISTGTVLELTPSYIGGFGKMYASTAIGGAGANSPQGSGGRPSGGSPNNGVGNGSGGSGAGATISTAAQAGGNGTAGFFLIYEYA